jgi:UDP-2-acetamido-2,6-beta-L-arabino-hexul-4-ose reductase
MNIAITGADGFIGKNLIEFLHHHLPKASLQLINRYSYNSGQLSEKIVHCEFIIHCAGINRSENVYEENINLQKTLLKAIEQVNFKGTLVNLSSIHAENDTEYGRVKRDIENFFQEHSISNSYTCFSLRLPNVYGPYSRENYNTVVATFIYNELFQIKSQVNSGKIDLIYVKNVCSVVKAILSGEATIDEVHRVPADVNIEIQELNLRISKLVSSTLGSKLELKSDFDKNLFRTITYFRLKNGLLQSTLKTHEDNRGWFSELLHLDGLGQVSVSKTNTKTPRGNHYHTKKLERFILIGGEAEVELIGFNGDKWKYILKHMSTIDIPNYYIHTLTKVSKEDLICAFWVDEFYDINNPDTFYI